ncbi:MAG TPA: hypothetical protein VFW02_08700 [Candidatus Limnocylindrales bacterium]|nr:hypothetical protein [Candidatus Limnocylindrales bacterium]
MSFLQRAREAAEAAAESAQHAAEAARTRASEVGQRASDPATHERLSRQAREAVGQARKGMATVVERIDPSTLAELIIKATALQEKTNASLRDKHSPYRISELSISASIPPGISFVISRIDEGEILSGHAVTSAELLDTIPDFGEAVVALDGTTGDVTGEEPQGTP